MNKYDELLKKFCTEDLCRWDLGKVHKSQGNDGLVFATDGHIACFVPSRLCEGKYRWDQRTPPAHSLFALVENVERRLVNSATISRPDEATDQKLLTTPDCNHCDGGATDIHDDEIEWCSWCDSTGKAGAPQPVWYDGGAFQWRYLKLIFDTAIEYSNGMLQIVDYIDVKNQPGKYFKIGDDIHIFLMPLRVRMKEECHVL